MLESFNAARTRRRSARRARQQLQSELATYRTETDVLDLEATLDRYPDEQTLEIRRILVQQAVS